MAHYDYGSFLAFGPRLLRNGREWFPPCQRQWRPFSPQCWRRAPRSSRWGSTCSSLVSGREANVNPSALAQLLLAAAVTTTFVFVLTPSVFFLRWPAVDLDRDDPALADAETRRFAASWLARLRRNRQRVPPLNLNFLFYQLLSMGELVGRYDFFFDLFGYVIVVGKFHSVGGAALRLRN
jgi:hypothetical protein